jgi:hypothetical protein
MSSENTRLKRELEGELKAELVFDRMYFLMRQIGVDFGQRNDYVHKKGGYRSKNEGQNNTT